MADTQHATNTFPPGFTVITRKIDDIRCLVRVGSSGIFLPAPIRHHLGDPRRVVVAANGGTSFALAPAGEDTPLTVSFSLSIGGLIPPPTPPPAPSTPVGGGAACLFLRTIWS